MKKKVLVIDDDEPILTMTKCFLEEDYDVTAVTSGKMALEMFSKGYIPHLVLLDLFMSEMGGWNILFSIQNLCKSNKKLGNTKIAIYTSSEDPNGLAKAKDFGAVDYIHKPISRLKMLEKVAELVQL